MCAKCSLVILQQGDIVVMDNIGADKNEHALATYPTNQRRGPPLTGPRSLDLNPIGNYVE